MYSCASLLHHLLWQLCRMYWPVPWYFDRGMINFNRSLLSAATEISYHCSLFFRNVVSIYVPGIWASLNGGGGGGVCLFCGGFGFQLFGLRGWGPTFPWQLGKTYAKEYPRIPYFENLQMHVPMLFKGGVGLCQFSLSFNFRRYRNQVWN